MSRIAVVYGTRPEAIKMAPLISGLRDSPHLEPIVMVTGQHREMLAQVHEAFSITPDLDLALFKPGQSLAQMTSRMLVALDAGLAQAQPDAIVVQGDTSSTLTASLTAHYHRIPVVHMEAGLRTDDRFNPFPEEMNRRLTTRLASLHLAPTALAVANLLHEGVSRRDVVLTGNTVIDALLHVAGEHYSPPRNLAGVHGFRGRIVLMTAHRRESWGEPMDQIASATASLATAHPDVLFVAPLHLNPVVRQSFAKAARLSNVVVLDPQPYVDFAHLIRASYLIVTDSGGIQEEAPSLGKPVLVIRDNTERPEAVDAGTARVVGTRADDIIGHVTSLLGDEAAHRRMATAANPFGDGRAAARSVAAIEHFLGTGTREPEFGA